MFPHQQKADFDPFTALFDIWMRGAIELFFFPYTSFAAMSANCKK
jgi:hypothetical protein